MGVSTKKLLSWAPLIEAMKQSLLEDYGVKIKFFGPDSRIKQAFYGIKREFEEFSSLSLLLTPLEGEYLIYHPSEETTDASERENGVGQIHSQVRPRNSISNAQILQGTYTNLEGASESLGERFGGEILERRETD